MNTIKNNEKVLKKNKIGCNPQYFEKCGFVIQKDNDELMINETTGQKAKLYNAYWYLIDD